MRASRVVVLFELGNVGKGRGNSVEWWGSAGIRGRGVAGGGGKNGIESARATPKAHLPYGMFLTHLFRYVMELYPHLDNGIYDVVERVMRPLALRQTCRPRSDCEKARHSVSSTSAHHNRGSSSHQGDDNEDDSASRASTP
nr:peptidyl-tRNA hydrolase family protein [Tanacetum cinerariifolium]